MLPWGEMWNVNPQASSCWHMLDKQGAFKLKVNRGTCTGSDQLVIIQAHVSLVQYRGSMEQDERYCACSFIAGAND